MDDQRQLAPILTHCPDAATPGPFVHEFRQLVREFDQEGLEGWLTAVDDMSVPECTAFCSEVRRDQAAIGVMLKEKWNNGHLEGQRNRPKMLKRQMYGRANFDLLRQRVVFAS